MENKSYKDKLIKRAYSFSIEVILFYKKSPPKDFASEVISKQLIRSATSVGANIVEAQASPTRKDFANFLNHALKSANETRYWIGLLRDTSLAEDERVRFLLKEAQELSKILGSSVKTLRNK